MDRNKLVELRKKKLEAQQKREDSKHAQVIAGQNKIAEALTKLYEVINDKAEFDDKKLVEQLEQLKTVSDLSGQFKRLETAIQQSKADTVEVSNLKTLVSKLDALDFDDDNIVTAIHDLTGAVQLKVPSQDPKDYIPVRRVRKIGQKLMFDDDPHTGGTTGGGAGGGGGGGAITGNVGLLNSGETRINPATEEKQDDLIQAIEDLDIDTTGLATEAKQDDIIAQIGEVQVTPTPNTVLGRLKDIYEAVDNLEVSVGDIEVNTDEIEAKLEDVKTKLDTVNSYLASLDGKDFATETTLASIIPLIDGIEAILTSIQGTDFATETTLASVLAAVDGLEALVTSTNSKLDTLNANDFATEAKQDSIITELQTIAGQQLPNNHDVVVTASALPTGASTEAKQDDIIVLLGDIEGAVDGIETILADLDLNTDEIEAKLEDIKTKLDTANATLTSIDGKDFATETTLAAVLAAVDGVEALLTTISNIDYATETTQQAVLAAVDGVETLITSTNTKLDTIITSVQIMDDWDESDRAKVNPIVGQAGIAAGSGTTGANTTRTVTATDSPDVVSLAVIDDWDESDRAKVNPVVGQAGIAAGAGSTSANTTRVVIANDQPLTPKAQTAVAAAAVSVTTSATSISAGGSSTQLRIIYNNSLLNVYIGFTNAVTTSTGFVLAPGETYVEDVYGGAIFGIVAAGSANVRVSAATT